MLTVLLSGLATALSLLVVDLIVPGVTINTIPAAAIAAVSIGVVNAFFKPILRVLTVPFNVLTFGLFAFVLNGLCFWLSSLAVPGFSVHGILAFLLGPVVLSFVSTFLNSYMEKYEPTLPGTTDLSRNLSSDSSQREV